MMGNLDYRSDELADHSIIQLITCSFGWVSRSNVEGNGVTEEGGLNLFFFYKKRKWLELGKSLLHTLICKGWNISPLNL
jgi:hypothetical protein